MTRAPEPSAETKPLGGRRSLKWIPPVLRAARSQRRVRDEDLQAAARHDEKEHRGKPMGEPNEQRLREPALETIVPGICVGILGRPTDWPSPWLCRLP